MTPETPRVAVVIPCFNDGMLALEAVASIREAEPVEVIVIDDASSDPASGRALDDLADHPFARVIRHPANRGLAAARMTGVHATAGRYVFPLDADDLAQPGALARMADLLDAHAWAAVCFGDYLEFGDHELVRAVPLTLDPYRVAYTNEYPPSALFRRTVLERLGGWQLDDVGYEDWDLWMTLAEASEQGIHAGHGFLTYSRRLHGTRMLTRSKRDHARLYRLLRRRHATLFGGIQAHRRASDMSTGRKLLYPIVYGGRRRFGFERRIKATLDAMGVWTLRR